MTQNLKPWNPREIEVPDNLSFNESEVAKVISAFQADGSIPDIIITEEGLLVEGANALEAAKRLNQDVVIVAVRISAKQDIDIQWISIDLLDPHPINTQIYGENEDVTDLAESISQNGLQEFFTVTPNGDRYTIIHGHRRRLACIQAGLKTIPAKVKNFSTTEDAIAALLSGNEYREKSIEQKAREYLAWEEIERTRAKSRQGRAGFGVGTTRDIIAKKVGLGSGVNAEHAVAAVKAMDEVKDPVKRSQLKIALSKPRGVDAAYKLVKPQQEPKGKPPHRWIPKQFERVKITGGPHSGKEATVAFLTGICVVVHIDGTPEDKRDQIPFNQMEPLKEEKATETFTSVAQETAAKQQQMGFGKKKQLFQEAPRNEEPQPPQLPASITNLNTTGDALVTEVAIALLKLTPKQMHEVMRRIEPELDTDRLNAIWKALEKSFAHKAA